MMESVLESWAQASIETQPLSTWLKSCMMEAAEFQESPHMLMRTTTEFKDWYISLMRQKINALLSKDCITVDTYNELYRLIDRTEETVEEGGDPYLLTESILHFSKSDIPSDVSKNKRVQRADAALGFHGQVLGFCGKLKAAIEGETSAGSEYQELYEECRKEGAGGCDRFLGIKEDEIRHHGILEEIFDDKCGLFYGQPMGYWEDGRPRFPGETREGFDPETGKRLPGRPRGTTKVTKKIVPFSGWLYCSIAHPAADPFLQKKRVAMVEIAPGQTNLVLTDGSKVNLV